MIWNEATTKWESNENQMRINWESNMAGILVDLKKKMSELDLVSDNECYEMKQMAINGMDNRKIIS